MQHTQQISAAAGADTDGSDDASEDDAKAYDMQAALLTEQQPEEDSEFEMEDDTEALQYLSTVRYDL